MQLEQYRQSLNEKIAITESGFLSTSLSECIALSFAVFSASKRLEHLDAEVSTPHLPVVLALTNRCENLPFLLPDALRKPQNNQGQMEILLNEQMKLQPTYIHSAGEYVKIYADIAA